MSSLPPRRQTVRRLITEGLGYCCPWAFFYLFRRTSLIAARLGVGDRAIRYWKMAVRNGEVKCEGCTGCKKPQIKLLRR